MYNDLFQDLIDKKVTKEELYKIVKSDYNLIPEIIKGVSSSKATIRYSCAKILMDLSKEEPEKLYDHMDFFIKLLDSKYRILTWNAIITIANINTDPLLSLAFIVMYNCPETKIRSRVFTKRHPNIHTIRICIKDEISNVFCYKRPIRAII